MILKSRHCVTRVLQLCYRNLNQARKPYPFFRYMINEPTFDAFTVNCSCRNYSTNNSEPLRPPIRDDVIGTKTVDPIIRGKAATELQISYIGDLLAGDDEVSDEQWSVLLDRISKVENGLFNSTNVDGKIMEECYLFNTLSKARSYLKFMTKIKKKFNVLIVISFIKLCYNNRFDLTPEDLARVDHFTKYLKSRFNIVDPTVGEAIMKGLCLKNYWQEGVSIMQRMRQYIDPSFASIGALVICLIENDQIEKAAEELERALSKKVKLSSEVYTTWLEKTKSNPEKVEQLLTTFRKHDVLPRKIVCDHLISIYSQFPPEKRLSGTYISVKNDGYCANCNEKLLRVSISEEEFNILRDEFLNRVLVNTDVFKNTTPEELKTFFEIVEKNAPFDIVIDGLNVMYMTGTLRSYSVYAKLLTDTVRHFVERDQKVLVLGRKHMYSFTKELLGYVRKNSTLLLIDDLSADDPYMIYATFYSGPDACFVTRDLMRSEKFRLNSEKLEILFKKWQLCHQIIINYISPTTGKLFVKSPILFELAPQPSKHGWHVPYHLESYTGADQYGVHEHWLCLKR